MGEIKLLELFGGIGACSKALECIGIDYELVDYVEIDKYAVASYNAIHGTNFEPQDICEWDKDVKVDLLMHGSPCQDFSLAGHGLGGDEDSGTRSSLMYETIRIVSKLKPKFVIWENVKNLLSKQHKHNFDNYINTLNELGYKSYYKVLNAKDFGIPQHRERVFTISILGNDNDYKFPEGEKLKIRLKDLLEDVVDKKYYLSEKMIEYITANNEKWSGNNNKSLVNKDIASTINTGEGSRRCDASNYVCKELEDNTDLKAIRKYGLFDKDGKKRQAGSVWDTKELAPTLDTMQGGYRQPCIEVASENKTIFVKNATKKGYLEAHEGDGVYISNIDKKRGTVQSGKIPTIKTNPDVGVVVNGETELKVRKLTPKECWRLMGFDDEDFNKAQTVCSNTQLYKQAGNSIVVNVLEAILTNLLTRDSNEGSLKTK